VKAKAKAAPVNGTDKLASLRKSHNEVRLIRMRCANLKRKKEWSLADLSAFVKAVSEAVGVTFEG